MKKVIAIFVSMSLFFGLYGCNRVDELSKLDEEVDEALNNSITIYSLKDDTLCPILTDNNANKQMLGIVYEPLVKLKNDMEAEGVLSSGWSVSEDGLIWTFNLRKDVFWHSGEVFSPNDVIYTIKQIKLNEDSPYSYNVSNITDAVVNGNAVSMVLNEPCANFPNLMTFPIIKNQETDVDRVTFYPLGTGPYIFTDKNEGNLFYLKKNDKWWGGDIKLSEVKVKLLPDAETVMYAFSAGDISIADTESGNTGRFANISDVRVSSYQSSIYNFLGINHNNTALSSIEARKAINLAIKRSKIVNDIFAENAEIATVPIRKDWFVNSKNSDFESDAGEAERLLLKNEWKKTNGTYTKTIENTKKKLDFELLVNNDNSSRVNIAESVKFDLEAIGIKIKVIPLSYEEYEHRITTGQYDMFIGSTKISDNLDYSYLLGSGNLFNYEDEKMNSILNEIKVTTKKEKILKKYNELSNRFNSQVPVIGICFENFDILYSDKISGELNSTSNNIYDGIFNLSCVDKE